MKWPRLLNTTALRLSLLYATLYGLFTAIALGFIYWSTGQYIDAQTVAGLRAEAEGFRRLLDDQGLAALEQNVSRRSAYGGKTERYYLLIGLDGHPLAGNLDTWPQDTYADSQVRRVYVPDDPAVLAEGRELLSLAVSLPDGYGLLIGQGYHEADELREHVFTIALVAIGATLLMAPVVGILIGRGVLKRIDAIGRTVDEIMAGDLSRRISLGQRGDEFDQLATRLSTMLARLEQLLIGLRQVADNVAHDLRTPLTRLRNRLEVTLLEDRSREEYRTVLEQAVEDTHRLIRTFSAMLDIAQAEAGVRRGDWTTVDLGILAQDLAELYEAVAEDQGLVFGYEAPKGICVYGDRQLLAQAIGNLLENAIKYTPTGGKVSLQVLIEEGIPHVVVGDTGPGIAPEARELVTQRFVRLEAARSSPGNGLGLSLVKAVAQLHQATLMLGDNHPGLRAELRFTTANYKSLGLDLK